MSAPLCRLLSSGRGRLYLSGIKGASMSSLALALSDLGFCVIGSDASPLPSCALSRAEISLYPENGEGLEGCDALVYSLAVSEQNPVRMRAKSLGVPEYSRPELLGALMLLYSTRIGISGSHGKSTSVAMLASILRASGREPTVFSGAELPGADAGYILGRGECILYEACEYKRAFLHFSPTCAIITSIDLDHTDCYSSREELYSAFLASVRGAKQVILPGDDPELYGVLDALGERAITFGRGGGEHYCYHVVDSSLRGTLFTVKTPCTSLELWLATPGEHNVRNATAVLAAADTLGIPHSYIRTALAAFSGIGRRLEPIARGKGITLYYDYAHHPKEIEATLRTLGELYGRVAVVFTPHTYTRTRDLFDGFATSLALAEKAFIADIFPAREEPIPGVDSRRLAAAIPYASYVGSPDDVIGKLGNFSGALVLMGAGEFEGALDVFKEYVNER
ncbi:MAG: UDP-N-acetylmuramate--L-alanine ligase [Clostridia bacterium]|nr:UDP-N-acetylmuramate--L-alanine ligase [Clostridia bacterium]